MVEIVKMNRIIIILVITTLSLTLESEAWNTCVNDLVRCSKAHCNLMLVSKFIEGVKNIPSSPVKSLMKQQCDLFNLWCIESNLGEFTEDGFGFASSSNPFLPDSDPPPPRLQIPKQAAG